MRPCWCWLPEDMVFRSCGRVRFWSIDTYTQLWISFGTMSLLFYVWDVHIYSNMVEILCTQQQPHSFKLVQSRRYIRTDKVDILCNFFDTLKSRVPMWIWRRTLENIFFFKILFTSLSPVNLAINRHFDVRWTRSILRPHLVYVVNESYLTHACNNASHGIMIQVAIWPAMEDA